MGERQIRRASKIRTGRVGIFTAENAEDAEFGRGGKHEKHEPHENEIAGIEVCCYSQGALAKRGTRFMGGGVGLCSRRR
jgi:hypothetical protein